MRRTQAIRFYAVPTMLLFAALIGSSGCIGAVTELLYVIKGDKVEPEFPGLKGKRVAVVCVENTSSHDPNGPATVLADSVEKVLRVKMNKDIKLVRQAEILDWMDKSNWDQTDYRDVGRGVKADMVLAIDLKGLKLHEDQTLYKGRANIVLTVYDMKKGGEPVYRRKMSNFCFPVNGGQHTTEISEGQFQQKFMIVLASDIAKHFYPYEMKEDFAREATLLGD